MSDAWDEEQLIGFFCRHLVALCISYRSIANGKLSGPQFFSAAGTIISFNDKFFFLTAGHSLQELSKAFDSSSVSIDSCVLADSFTQKPVSDKPIPFDFLGSPKFSLNQDGLDFGLIGLRSHYVRLLAANGVKAVGPENWEHQDSIDFHGYVMLGLPDEFESHTVTGVGAGRLISAQVSPTLISLTRLATPPEGSPKFEHDRFVGQIDPRLEIGSIVGMSGGPILGFTMEPPIRYWVIAIQSSWIRRSRITFGCPIPVIGEFLRELAES